MHSRRRLMVATARDGQTEHRPIDVSGIREEGFGKDQKGRG